MKKLILIVIGVLFACNVSASAISEGAIIKTEYNPDVYIVKYKNGKQFKRLVLNPQVFESYGHLRWEDILRVSQSEMNSFATSNLVRVDGRTDIYQLAPNGDIGNKHLLVSTDGYDLDSAYTINDVDFGNYKAGDVKGIENLVDKKDNDYDGLENWEEDQRGTDKNNSDTDGDGIIDGLDSHPNGGGRYMSQYFKWDYLGTQWTWEYSFHSDWYDYYKNKERSSHSAEYVAYDDRYIQEIADMLIEKADERGYSKSTFAAAFVQSLEYVSDIIIGYDDYPKYPLETLAEQNGDCEDTSYLLAAIVRAMPIDCVLVLLPGHMAVAIAFSGSPEGYYYKLNNGRNYYYIETTSEGRAFGEIPDKYKNIKAILIKIPSNEREEASPSFMIDKQKAEEQERLRQERLKAEEQERLRRERLKTEEQEKIERLTKATQAIKQLIVILDIERVELENIQTLLENKNAEIENTKNRSIPMSSINSALARLIPEYNILVEQHNVQLEYCQKIIIMIDVIESYAYGDSISYRDKEFLRLLGIYL